LQAAGERGGERPRSAICYSGRRRERTIGHRAHVYLQRPGLLAAVDLGEKELDVRPIQYGRAQFEHDGRTEVGRIERIDPADWDTTGAVPKVLVVQRQ
jgi:hypothetical protein